MRITEAVEKGREILEPRQGADLYPPEDGKYGGCYRGMALVGCGAVKLPLQEEIDSVDGWDGIQYLAELWPWTVVEGVDFPCSCSVKKTPDTDTHTVANIITHLWDRHVNPDGFAVSGEEQDDPWTFERITDWVRSIEPADVVPTA
jgi:hypothetical protein